MKVPVTIVTGFLGSGKTTLITSLLRGTPDKRLAILVNEFGEVSVDGAILRSHQTCGVEIHDLPNGCICCTVQDDFLPTMAKLQQRKHQIDHVIIETSGLALPTPVMRALSWPEVRNDFELDAVITVVDTPLLLEGAFEIGQQAPGADKNAPAHLQPVEAIFSEQLDNADVVVLNKIDELSDEMLEKAESLVRSKASKVRFLELAWHAEIDTRLCLGLNLHSDQPAGHAHGHGHDHHHGPVHSTPEFTAVPIENQAQFNGHAHSGLTAHEHGEHTHEHFHEHDTGWQSFVLHSHEKQSADLIKDAVREVAKTQPILRAKGYALTKESETPLLLQAVRSRVQAHFDQSAADVDDTRLVFIGYHPNRKQIAKTLTETTGTHWH